MSWLKPTLWLVALPFGAFSIWVLSRGRPWWPWVLLTLVAGSFGPSAYLLWPKR